MSLYKNMWYVLVFYKKALVGSIKRRGLFGTLVFILSDIFFDLRYGTDTRSTDEIYDTNIDSADKKNFYRYHRASNYYIVRKLLDSLKINFNESLMVDFGSGRGRVLLVALEYGFKRIIGVEISAALCAACEKNLNIYRRGKHKYDITEVKIVNADAAKYRIPDNSNVFCFSNPFGREVFDQVLSNIDKSLKLRRRTIYIVYINPVFKGVLENKGFHCLLDLHREAVIFIKCGYDRKRES